MKQMIRTSSLLSLFLLCACTNDLGRFSLISTKIVEISRVDLKKTPFKRDTTGEDTRLWFLFFPFGEKPTLEKAVDDCLKNGQGDFIIDGKIQESGWSILLFSGGGYTVNGDVGNALDSGDR